MNSTTFIGHKNAANMTPLQKHTQKNIFKKTENEFKKLFARQRKNQCS